MECSKNLAHSGYPLGLKSFCYNWLALSSINIKLQNFNLAVEVYTFWCQKIHLKIQLPVFIDLFYLSSLLLYLISPFHCDIFFQVDDEIKHIAVAGISELSNETCCIKILNNPNLDLTVTLKSRGQTITGLNFRWGEYIKML